MVAKQNKNELTGAEIIGALYPSQNFALLPITLPSASYKNANNSPS